MSAEYDVWMK